MNHNIQENLDISKFTTFKVESIVSKFITFSSVKELNDLFTSFPKYRKKFLCLGEGSNVLFVHQPFSGLVLKNEIRGINITKETDEVVSLKVGAGENWHAFVMYCVDRGWGGVENLSLIPGTVGAAPIQNIGAYGVEVKDVIESVEFYNVHSQEILVLQKNKCEFSYRDSIFKSQGRGKWIITQVHFNLSKTPKVKTTYGAIQAELEKRKIINPSIKDISEIVIDIRKAKLPDPTVLGNAGSFFKNPIISSHQFHQLKSVYPQVVAYEEPNGHFKLAAGWLIEKCGLKGYRHGKCGVHIDQALVLVNYGGATGKDILSLAELVQEKVHKMFHVSLEKEVHII